MFAKIYKMPLTNQTKYAILSLAVIKAQYVQKRLYEEGETF